MAEPIIMPKLGFDMAEGTLINWTVQIGQAIKKGDVIAEIETDKATIEIETTVEGTVLQLLAEPGDVVAVGSPIGYVGAEGEARRRVRSRQHARRRRTAPSTRAGGPGRPAAAAAERAAMAPQDQSIAAGWPERTMTRRVKGTGPGGRITKKDIESFVAGQRPRLLPRRRRSTVRTPIRPKRPPDHAHLHRDYSGPDVEIIPLSRIRARIGQRWASNSCRTSTCDIDVAAALALRQLNASISDEAGRFRSTI